MQFIFYIFLVNKFPHTSFRWNTHIKTRIWRTTNSNYAEHTNYIPHRSHILHRDPHVTSHTSYTSYPRPHGLIYQNPSGYFNPVQLGDLLFANKLFNFVIHTCVIRKYINVCKLMIIVHFGCTLFINIWITHCVI